MEENFKAIQEVVCSPSQHGNSFLYTLTTLNIALSITASLGNIVILVALRKETSLYPPSKLLLQCLAVTDLCVGVFSQPVFVIQLLSIVHRSHELCYAAVSVNSIVASSLIGVSLLTITLISVDRLLALVLGLRHRKAVSLRRTRGIVISFWILSVSICSLRFFWEHYVLISRLISGIVALLLAISAISYMKIYLSLRRHRNEMQDVAHQGGQLWEGRPPLSTARYKKTVSTALCVQLAVVVCYLPYGIVSAIAEPFLTSNNLATKLTITLLYLNSSLNPILYCWKIGGVRKAVKVAFSRVCCVVCPGKAVNVNFV